ncbi:putative quinol monooxygenase [Methyloceanibacter sp.]|jgi:quinol monooxygenase YgiN|uniref:putative quinol monooxygenase n=1 Tax=Methyloceanibacter sp. TaxID=1965321 RepID=UPI0035683B2F
MYRILSENTFEVKDAGDVQKMKQYLRALGDVVEEADSDIVIYYFVHSTRNECEFTCFEMYRSDSAFMKHQASDRYREIIDQLKPLIREGSFTTTVWSQDGHISDAVESTFRNMCDTFIFGEAVGGFIR